MTYSDTDSGRDDVNDKNRANILADITGHPQGTPSIEELDYMNPRMAKDEIRRQLHELENEGIVQVLEIDTEAINDGAPRQFWELTEDARELFDQDGLFPEESWQRQYQTVSKPDRIKKIEAMPRPDRGD